MTLPNIAVSDYLLGVGQLVTIWLVFRDGSRERTRNAAEEAARETKSNIALNALTTEFAKLSDSLKTITDELTSHRLEDREIHTRLSEAQSTMTRLLEKHDERVTALERRRPSRTPAV